MWEELGIAATADVKLIRKAYAGRLRRLDPDRDLAGFQRLRQAFEAALAEAASARGRTRSPPQAKAEDEAAVEAVPIAQRAALADTGSVAEENPEEAEAASHSLRIDAAAAVSARRSFDRALAAGDIEIAFARLIEALARGLLSLDEQHATIAEFMAAAVDHPTVPGERFVFMARQLGWEQPRLAARTEDRALREKVAGRLDAEAWYAGLLSRAAAQEPWLNHVRRQERWLARFLLGRAARWQIALHVNAALISWQLASYDAFESWLGGRIDPRRLAGLRASWLRWPLRDTGVSSYWAIVTAAIALIVPSLLVRRLLRRGEAGGRGRLDPTRLEWWREMARMAAQRKLPSATATLRNVLLVSIKMMLFTVLIALVLGLVIAGVAFPPLGVVVVATGFILGRARRRRRG
jgi:hypothetical protein